MKQLVYLHGFLSSPKSFKASITEHWVQRHRPDINYYCPELSSYPHLAIQTIKKLIEVSGEQTMVIGSSLGGYWATWMANEYDIRAVVINPAVKPSILKPDFLGVELKSYYSDDTYILNEKDVENLKSVYVKKISRPENIWLMAQTGDETCDYRLAVEKYQGCRQLIEEGGDHSFQNYESWIPKIIEFLEVESD